MITPTTIVYVTPRSPEASITPYRSLVRHTAPSSEPVSLSEAKTHARVDTTDDDTYISSLIAASREYVEDRLDTTLLTTIWEARYDSFPMFELVLPRPPMLPSAVTITYRNEGGTDQTITSTSSDFRVDHRIIPGRLTPNYEETWPAVRGDENSVTVQWSAGYGAASSVPASIKHAMLLLIGHWYEARQPVAVGNSQGAQVPLTFETLIHSMSHGVYR